MIERELCQRGVAEARRRLEAWRAEVDDERLLARLGHESPLHPLLWAYRLGIGAMSMLVALCLASLGAPLISYHLARFFSDLDALTSIPTPLVFLFLGYSLGAAGVSARWFALQRARACPLLPEEDRTLQSLKAELRRAERQLEEFEAREAGLSA